MLKSMVVCMNFIKILKTKLFTKTVKESSKEDDIALLAYICQICEPCIIKQNFFVKYYAYYVPESDCYLDIAKDVFKQNDIKMQVHYSYILGGSGKNVLRMDYRKSKNFSKDMNFFNKIKDKRIDFFMNKISDEEKTKLYNRLSSLEEQVR